MSSDYIKKTDTSTVYYHVLITCLSLSKEMMCLCKKYITWGLVYHVEQDLNCCLKYVYSLY